MIALGYLRIDGATTSLLESPTLAEQEEVFHRYCREQGYEPETTFVDSTESPAQQSSSGYHRLVARLLWPQRPFTVVVVGQLDRLGPTPKEVVRRLLELESVGAPVFCLREGSLNPLSSALEVWQQAWRKELRSSPVRAAMEAKVVQGIGVGRPAYGYRIGSHGKFEPVTEEAAVVQRIFRLYGEEGLGLRLIAKNLNQANFTTRRGGAWSLVALRDLLRNRVYLGTYSRFGVRIPANHPPLVSPELFQKALQHLTARSAVRSPQTSNGGVRAPLLLSGLLQCGACGAAMVGLRRRQSWTHGRDGSRAYGEYLYYQCGSRLNQSRCAYHTQRARELEELVIRKLRHRFTSEGLQAWQASPSLAQHAPGNNEAQGPRVLLQRRVESYLKQAVRGVLSVGDLRGKACPTLWELFTLRDQGQMAEEASFAYLAAGRWEALPFLQRRALLRELVERIVVHDDRIEMHFRPSAWPYPPDAELTGLPVQATLGVRQADRVTASEFLEEESPGSAGRDAG